MISITIDIIIAVIITVIPPGREGAAAGFSRRLLSFSPTNPKDPNRQHALGL